MAAVTKLLSRSLSLQLRKHIFHPSSPKLFSTNPTTRNPKLVNFSLPSDSEDSESDDRQQPPPRPPLPPPYNPFAQKQPSPSSNKFDVDDPSDLQQVFHNIRTDPQALTSYAATMFDYLSKQNLTHEALSFFSFIKDKGHMPDVIPFTAVIEAYANAGGGQSRQAEKVWMRMLASGVEPNVYTYDMLVRGVARDGRLREVRKYAEEMVGKGMKGSAEMWVEVVEGYVRENKEEEGRALWAAVRGKLDGGFDERAVREAVKGRRGPLVRAVMGILLGKS